SYILLINDSFSKRICGGGFHLSKTRILVPVSATLATMDDFLSEDKTTFIVEEVSKIIKDSVETVIGENSYKHGRVNQWTTSVVEQCLIQLSKLDKPFKFIVNCIIMQKNGAGLQTASTCCWDNTTDGSCTVRWENDTMYVIISVFGLAI
ncbi:hypothetical protein CCH79_00000401, partial [Gambusia affinis]